MRAASSMRSFRSVAGELARSSGAPPAVGVLHVGRVMRGDSMFLATVMCG